MAVILTLQVVSKVLRNAARDSNRAEGNMVRESVGWAARQAIESNEHPQILFELTAVCHQKKVIYTIKYFNDK